MIAPSPIVSPADAVHTYLSTIQLGRYRQAGGLVQLNGRTTTDVALARLLDANVTGAPVYSSTPMYEYDDMTDLVGGGEHLHPRP